MQEINGNQMLSESKFYMGYSRWQEYTQSYETWEESVGRVMDMHRTKYFDKMTPELSSLIDFAEQAYKDKVVLGSQRALQFGGEQLLAKHPKLYNCFEKSVEFVTSEGVKKFSDFNDGDHVVVLGHSGQWRNAVVRSYGEQSFNRVSFSKQSAQKSMLVTGNHRWILRNGKETTALKLSDAIVPPPNSFGFFDYESATPMEKLYWCYGMVYGDGTRVKDNGVHRYSMIRLCGKDKRFADRFEEMGFRTSTNDSLTGDFMAYTGTYLKTSPNPEIDSPELIRAFVAGYLQADGEKNKSFVAGEGGSQYLSIQSSEEDHIEFIRKCFPIAGAWILSERDLTGQETNYGVRPYTISFRINTSGFGKTGSGWRVSSIEECVSVGTAWCLEVDDDHSFVMPSGIVTGNCSSSYCDRPEFFNEAFYLLLCGCGVGFSVQNRHVKNLPTIVRRSAKKVKVFQIPDSIEGWADALAVLMSSYFSSGNIFPEYKGCQVHFDFSKIRPKGSMISGGFKAPGPDGLRAALLKVESLLENSLMDRHEVSIKPIVAYDITMHISDAVLSGGVRRSATICLFDKDDQEMLNAKTGDWFVANPQRARSNNSAVIKRDELSRGEWAGIMKSVKEFGEPGFFFVNDLDFVTNPCVEIGMRAYTEDGRSGFQMCNLCEINGGKIVDIEKFLNACKAAAILGTLQAGYTKFGYLSKASQEITEREALIGVSITGWMNNPEILFDRANMVAGAELVKEVNKHVAKLLGINPAARTTCAKPSGNASVLLSTASGIHGEHAPMYFRNVQMNEQDEVLHMIRKDNPKMVSPSVWSANGTDYVVSFPVVSKEGSIFKEDLLGVKQLEYVKLAQQFWVEAGTDESLCVDKNLRHNISNTITVDDWEEVEQYIFDNKDFFAGVSLLSGNGGDKAYAQAPFTEVISAEDILVKYGEGSLFASGLIVDALHAFNQNLWQACDTVSGYGLTLSETDSADLLRRDWVRRAKKFAAQYFDGNVQQMTFCLKDCYNRHKWASITKDFRPINFSVELSQPKYIEVDTIGSAGCSGPGGSCEITF